MSTIKATFPSEEEFQQALASYGMTLEALKKDMEPQIKLRKLLEPQVNIANTDIQTYYDTNLETLKEPEQVKASHILVQTKEEAESILAELKNGGDFVKLAKEKSLDTQSKESGGDLGFFPKGVMEEAFDNAAFTLQINTLSDLVQTTHGYHIVKVAERKEARTPTFDEKKEEIRETLINEQLSTLSSSWMQEKMSGATIETFL
jgi:foldase protein PrsA